MDIYEGKKGLRAKVIFPVQPVDGNQPSIPPMKAWDVPFHLPYGNLVCP